MKLEKEELNKRTLGRWITKLKKEFPLETTKIYLDVEKEKIMFPSIDDWSLSFQPQVTIQHPLEFTIPLSFGLFGFDNKNISSKFIGSLPFLHIFNHLIRNYEGFKNIHNQKNTIYNLLTKKQLA